MFWKHSISKNIALEYDLYCIIRKDDIFSPENMILFFTWKMEGLFSQKNKWKYDIFCKCSEKTVFPKILRWNMIFVVLSGNMVFLFPENMILFFRRKMKYHLSEKNTVKMVFLFLANMILPLSKEHS